eukprot:Tbor_TRINITY_DN4238_c0_g1::TRINITY_DN4238_c0_g1_i2::g.23846::m.23846/K03635/MOCS2B, moaE; molybdopterin synthase catalytic subunit
MADCDRIVWHLSEKSLLNNSQSLIEYTDINWLEDIVSNGGEALVEIVDGNKIDTHRLQEQIATTSPACGAVSSFLGITRGSFNGKAVEKLSYVAYKTMAMKEMIKIVREVFKSYQGIYRVIISHRLGDCPVGEASVYIAVASAHRQPGLEATQFAINTLKARVPIWKKEHFTDGTVTGEGCCQDICRDGLWKENVEFDISPPS